jgi:hypothetical protein
MSPFAIATAPFAGKGLQSYRAFDFSGGLDVNTAPTKLALRPTNTHLTLAHNVIYRFDGSVESRTGTEDVCRATTLLNAGGVIQGGVHFRRSGGVNQVIVAIAGKLYRVDSPTAVTQIYTGLTSNRRYFFATYQDTLFIANGADPPMQYDGTTVTLLGGGAPAQMHVVVVHGNRLFCTSRGAANRDTIYWSKLNNPFDWTGTSDAGAMDINPNDGGNITDLVSGIQELIILKTNRTYRLQGIGPTTGYTLVDNMVPATGSTGCQWSGAAVFAGNDVWYVSREGLQTLSAVSQFGDLSTAYGSLPIRPYFTSSAGAFETNFAPDGSGRFSQEQVQLVSNEGNDTLVLGTCTGHNVVEGWDRLLVYDRRTKGWAEWRLGDADDDLTHTTTSFQVTSMWPYKDIDTGRTTLCLGCIDMTDQDGAYIVKLTEPDSGGDQSDSGGHFTDSQFFTTVVEHISCLGAPNVLKSPRYLFLYFKEGGGPVRVDVYYDGHSTPTVTTVLTLASSIDAAETLIIKRVDLWGECEFMAVRLGIEPDVGPSGNYTLLGYEVQWREIRRVRRAE